MREEDMFARTVETYCSLSGAAAYVGKEMKHAAARRGTVYLPLEGLELDGWRVLDVGCGFGRDVAEFRRRGAVAFGCDVSDVLLGKARSDYGEGFAKYDVRGGGALPFHGGFDLIWCCAVFVHVPRAELDAVIGRMWEGLKPGGRMVMTTKEGQGEKVVDNLGAGLERMMVYYSPGELVNAVRRLGGDMEAMSDSNVVLPTGDALMWVRARKPFGVASAA